MIPNKSKKTISSTISAEFDKIGEITTTISYDKENYSRLISSTLITTKGEKVIFFENAPFTARFGDFGVMDSYSGEYGELAYQLLGYANYEEAIDIRRFGYPDRVSYFILFSDDTLSKLSHTKEIIKSPKIFEAWLETVFNSFSSLSYNPNWRPMNLCFAYLAAPENKAYENDREILDMLRKAKCGVFRCVNSCCGSNDCYTAFYLNRAFHETGIKKWQKNLPEEPTVITNKDDCEDEEELS